MSAEPFKIQSFSIERHWSRPHEIKGTVKIRKGNEVTFDFPIKEAVAIEMLKLVYPDVAVNVQELIHDLMKDLRKQAGMEFMDDDI